MVRVLVTKRQTLTIAAIHGRHYVCFGERAAGLGLRVFRTTFILRMASLPSLVYGFHCESEDMLRAHAFLSFFPGSQPCPFLCSAIVGHFI
jgi:hypothetical protein